MVVSSYKVHTIALPAERLCYSQTRHTRSTSVSGFFSAHSIQRWMLCGTTSRGTSSTQKAAWNRNWMLSFVLYWKVTSLFPDIRAIWFPVAFRADIRERDVIFQYKPKRRNHPHGGARPFHEKATCLTQSTLGPYVVQIWSRHARNFEPTKPAYCTVWASGSEEMQTHARPCEPHSKLNFEHLFNFGEKCPQNGSKNEVTAPKKRL